MMGESLLWLAEERTHTQEWYFCLDEICDFYLSDVEVLLAGRIGTSFSMGFTGRDVGNT